MKMPASILLKEMVGDIALSQNIIALFPLNLPL